MMLLCNRVQALEGQHQQLQRYLEESKSKCGQLEAEVSQRDEQLKQLEGSIDQHRKEFNRVRLLQACTRALFSCFVCLADDAPDNGPRRR